MRVILSATGEVFTYQKPICFIKNIHMGEKYIEPNGTVTIRNESTGEKATISFKPVKGLFGGRSEEVSIEAFDAEGRLQPCFVTGKWSEALTLHNRDNPGSKSAEIWKAGPLVDDSDLHCGLPLFSAQLNEITEIEDGKVCATDSRLRPDQRLYENGHVDEAEILKLKLEANQRERRKTGVDNGAPAWFEKVEVSAEDGPVWSIIDGPANYWTQRQKGFPGHQSTYLW